MRVGVTGGRDFADTQLIEEELDALSKDAILVHGAASGADRLAANCWESLGRKVEPHPAKWSASCRESCIPGHRRSRPDGSSYCPAAGNYRNQEMVDSGLDLLIAFPGGRGTADMVLRAEAADITIFYAGVEE